MDYTDSLKKRQSLRNFKKEEPQKINRSKSRENLKKNQSMKK